jgi:hypothetical protein
LQGIDVGIEQCCQEKEKEKEQSGQIDQVVRHSSVSFWQQIGPK